MTAREPFLGTDRLSMAVGPHFQKYVKMQKRHIVFEGDRLFTKDNLKLLGKHYDLRINHPWSDKDRVT